APGFQGDQPAIPADAMVLVDDRRTRGELAQVADDRLGLATGTLAPTRLACAFGKELAFGEDRDRRFGEREAVVQRCDRNGEATQGIPFSRVRERVARRAG